MYPTTPEEALGKKRNTESWGQYRGCSVCTAFLKKKGFSLGVRGEGKKGLKYFNVVWKFNIPQFMCIHSLDLKREREKEQLLQHHNSTT